jgi:hypothetical protein
MGSDKMNEEDWINISDKFYDHTNFPIVIGAVDGKHVRVVKPDNSGSKYFNYIQEIFLPSIDGMGRR